MFVNVIPASITPAVQRIKLTKDLHQHSDICSPNYCFKNDFGFVPDLFWWITFQDKFAPWGLRELIQQNKS